MNRNFVILIAIIFLTALAGFFVYPHTNIFGVGAGPLTFGSKISPWRLGLDLVGGSHLVYEVDLSGVSSVDQASVLNGLRDIMENRVNLFGVSEPNIVLSKSRGKSQIIVELAGIKDPEEAISQIGRTALLVFAEETQTGSSTNIIPTELTGRYLVGAGLTSDEQIGQPQVTLRFNAEGARLFENITARNVGKFLNILVDNQIVSHARVNERIPGGNAVITGMDVKSAQSLVNLLNAGALPAPVTIVSQSTIGATLGSQFLKDAIVAGAVGTLLVIIFLCLYYRSWGFLASAALLIYIILTLAIFKIMSVTMSLSGIAGFILSIGMAVDANVLIFERTKEEMKKGLAKIGAMEEGFRRAWPSIRDSNISTIITAIILYFFTTSFVQGFALTLLMGVLISMFSSITVTRTLLRVVYG